MVHACEAIFPSWTATRLHALFIVSVRVWHHIWMAGSIYSVLFCHALLGFRVVVIIDDTSSFRLRSASQASYASSTPDDASRWCHPVCQSRYPRDTYSYMFQLGCSRVGCGIRTLASFVPACFLFALAWFQGVTTRETLQHCQACHVGAMVATSRFSARLPGSVFASALLALVSFCHIAHLVCPGGGKLY